MEVWNEKGVCDKVLKRRDVAELLGVTPRTVDAMAADGILIRIYLPHRKRAFGYSANGIFRMIADGGNWKQKGTEQKQ